HDILKEEHYQIDNLIRSELASDEHFIFSHYPLDDPPHINFCGHLHPGFRIQGTARQAVTLPCFYFDGTHFILPAFGSLTGLYTLEEKEDAAYYLVTGTRVIHYAT